MGFREEDHRGKMPLLSHYIKVHSLNKPADVDRDHLAEVGLARFLHCKVPLLPLVHAVLSGRKSLCTSNAEWEVRLSASRVE